MFFVKSAEIIFCPCCNGGLGVIGSRKRKYIKSEGINQTIIIRMLRCISCRKIHHELPDLKPIGIGTPYVERLTSYIKRLAEAHLVSHGNLLGKEIIPSINRDYLKVNHYIGFESININAMASGISEAIVRILEDKTFNYGLKYLTMNTWKECFVPINMFRKNQAWCPFCYEERLQLKQPIYEQLIWSFKDVNFCGKHKIRLIQKCSYCNSEFNTFSSRSRIGFCDNCNSWLGLKYTHITSINEEWHNYEA